MKLSLIDQLSLGSKLPRGTTGKWRGIMGLGLAATKRNADFGLSRSIASKTEPAIQTVRPLLRKDCTESVLQN